MMTRNDVAKKFNVSYETIRNWEMKGIIKPESISPTGRRGFNQAEIEDLFNKTFMQHQDNTPT